MTSAERKQASRERLVQQGDTEFYVRLGGHYIEFISNWASTVGEPRSKILQQLLEASVNRMILTMNELQQMEEAGASDRDKAEVMLQAMTTANSKLTDVEYSKLREAITKSRI